MIFASRTVRPHGVLLPRQVLAGTFYTKRLTEKAQFMHIVVAIRLDLTVANKLSVVKLCKGTLPLGRDKTSQISFYLSKTKSYYFVHLCTLKVAQNHLQHHAT